jgi:hypothetical protein
MLPLISLIRSRLRKAGGRGAWCGLCLAFAMQPLSPVLAGPAPDGEKVTTAPRHDPGSLQVLVDRLRARLSMSEAVFVSIVPANRHVVSVEATSERARFHLAIERSFLEVLSEDELEAAIAHELGHVWVFTHHPTLQTEPLANRIALQLVDRASLVRVYEKLWRRDGTTGNLADVLGPERAQP